MHNWCCVPCEMHLWSLQTMVRNEMLHFPNQGSIENNTAVSSNFFSSEPAGAVGLIHAAPCVHSHQWGQWAAKAKKPRE